MVLLALVGFGGLVCPARLAVLLVVCLSGLVCVRCGGGGASRYACRGFGMAGRQHVFVLPWLCPQER